MKQNRTIMGACDYSIAVLQNLKKTLMDYGNPNQEMTWAIGGIVVTLSSQLLKLCHEIFIDASKSGEPNAKEDIRAIQKSFNEFIDRMVTHD